MAVPLRVNQTPQQQPVDARNQMSLLSTVRLVLLAAIWGGAFLIIRTAVPALGPIALIACRVGLAAIFLALAAKATGRTRLDFARHWRHYLVVGTLNGALPFLLFGYAAQTLSASLLTILNATSPIWGAVVEAVISRRPLERSTALGLMLGLCGVTLVVGLDRNSLQPGGAEAILASLMAALSYGVAATYARTARSVDSFSTAHGSMWVATVILLPLGLLAPPPSVPATQVVFAVLVLGVVCTGFAFLLFFRLVQDIGSSAALTVTFLIPLFGITFGSVFLGEEIGWHTLAGSVLIIAGTALVAGRTTLKMQRNPA
jgi:drug/metabolite transporter (DMT)-like permease